jgi:hypothetical protein
MLDKLPQQPKAAGTCSRIRSTHEHGAGKRAGDVDRDAKKGERKARTTSEQRAIHSEAFLEGRLGDHRDKEPEVTN